MLEELSGARTRGPRTGAGCSPSPASPPWSASGSCERRGRRSAAGQRRARAEDGQGTRRVHRRDRVARTPAGGGRGGERTAAGDGRRSVLRRRGSARTCDRLARHLDGYSAYAPGRHPDGRSCSTAVRQAACDRARRRRRAGPRRPCPRSAVRASAPLAFTHVAAWVTDGRQYGSDKTVGTSQVEAWHGLGRRPGAGSRLAVGQDQGPRPVQRPADAPPRVARPGHGRAGEPRARDSTRRRPPYAALRAPRAARARGRAGTCSSPRIAPVGPSATIRPSSITTVRGKTSSTRRMSWVETSSVWVSPSSSPISSRRPRGSRPADGSSNTSTSGSIESTVASATRLRWPRLRRCGHPPLEAGHPDRGQRALDAVVDLVLGHAHVQRPERDVLEHGRAEQLVVGILEHEADLGPDPPDRRPVDDHPADPHAAVARLVDAVEVEHQRALAGAVRARPARPSRRAPIDEVEPLERLEPVGVARSGGARCIDRGGRRHRPGVVARAPWCSWSWACAVGVRDGRARGVARAARPASSQRGHPARGRRPERRRSSSRISASAAYSTGRSAAAVDVAELALEARAPASRRRSARCARTSGGTASRPSRPSRVARQRDRAAARVPSRPRGARRPRPRHPGRLLGEHREVAVHEADDRDHDPRQAQLAEAVDEVVERRRERQQQRRLDADPALEGDRRELLAGPRR